MLQGLVAEPNIVYLILVFGLWAAVTATYVPGTGVLEILAGGALIVEIILLQSMPVSWVAVLLLVVGVLCFLLIPFLNQRWARAAQGGLILQAIGGFFLFNGLQVSWALIALTVAISLAYHRLILMPLLTRLHEQPPVIDDNARLIGTTGRVVKAFEPTGHLYTGTVQANGEQWSASSPKPLQTGDEIVVIDREGLQLSVEGIKYKHTIEEV